MQYESGYEEYEQGGHDTGGRFKAQVFSSLLKVMMRQGALIIILRHFTYYLTRARLEPTSDLGKAVLGNWV